MMEKFARNSKLLFQEICDHMNFRDQRIDLIRGFISEKYDALLLIINSAYPRLTKLILLTIFLESS